MRAKTGTIDTTKAGKMRVRVPFPDGKRRTVGVYDTIEEARATPAASLKLLYPPAAQSGITVAQFGEEVISHREVMSQVARPEKDWSIWRTHILASAIARMPVKAVRPRHIDELRDAAIRRGLGRGSLKGVVALVRTIFRAAIRKRLITSNPAREVELPAVSDTEDPNTHATPAEQVALIGATERAFECTKFGVGPEADILAFAMGSAIRAGELVSLKLEDVHLEGDDPHIVIRYSGKPRAGKTRITKGKKIREVPLFGMSFESLKRWLAQLPSYAPENPLGLVFPGRQGEYRNATHIFQWGVWKKILKKAGITRRFRWHDLRHTGATSLISGWWGRAWTLAELQKYLGHASSKDTERYAKFADTALKKAARETRAQWPSLDARPAAEEGGAAVA